MHTILEYGPVLCVKGKDAGRIGYLDDFESGDCSGCNKVCACKSCELELDECEICKKSKPSCDEYGIVYWGHPMTCSGYHYLLTDFLTNEITMDDILKRYDQLRSLTAMKSENKEKAILLQELQYVQTLMYERHIQTHMETKSHGLKLFISHSSKDKGFANTLYTDLKEAKMYPWLDEWDILGGQSIPHEIQKGIDNSDFLLILLSRNSVHSNWVRTEWESAIWDENREGRVKVIPVLLEECELPRFLKYKKYIDFSEDYNAGYRELIRALSQV